ncbi:hypothetical protein BP5796_02570 [Coleophoma crateriformis]|uniref:Uncharacterized protein n=1 Tax=Coleophoma crateriformis TaxID=565419 RepID=A0A3D8SYL3_9HELO|nr:hypothetical protein BP5796_02570 [Coleophoma crateriformis]
MSENEAQSAPLPDSPEQEAGPGSASLKRSSSIAGNAPPTPALKRPSTDQSHESASDSLQYVYIVQQASYPQYGEGGDEILSVYSSLEAANAEAHDHIETEYGSDTEDVDEGVDKNGCFWWSAPDVGEGDGVRVYVQRWEVKR